MIPRYSGAAILAASLLSIGCGSGDPPRVAVFPAGGTVQRSGKPLANVMVRFQAVDPPAVPPGAAEVGSLLTETDEAGQFTLSTYTGDDGAPAGDYLVTVHPGSGPEPEDRDGPARPTRVNPALARYSSPKTSPLKATINPDGNQGDNRFVFELE
ncbi:hypothetical protein P12x_004591 [Tundrisphaera lichenicola]|uniref:hypothetical protein n=1 Tax=Tundrisphaera lichenicola TaxID=2029860 RepID=UPI003EBBC302